jgi:hypothetical protein
VHDALRLQLDSGIVRLLADLAEHPRPISDAVDKKGSRIAEERAGVRRTEERKEFFDLAWRRCESFLRAAHTAYTSRWLQEGQGEPVTPTSPALLGPAFSRRLLAAMRIPVIEAAFSQPWTAAARRVLPSPSPQFTATAMWGPLLGWCALELLAESIDAENPEKMALDLFDRLRLREPFGQAFGALGFEGEEAWRVAARIKVVLLSEAGIGKAEASASATESSSGLEASEEIEGAAIRDSAAEKESAAVRTDPEAPAQDVAESAAPGMERVALAPALWADPDVRWLTGAHETNGHSYLIRERYEELLWWLLMPALLRLAGEPTLDRAAIGEMGRFVEEALMTAESAGYRIDALLAIDQAAGAADKPDAELQAVEPEQTETRNRKSEVPETRQTEGAPEHPRVPKDQSEPR